MTSDESYPEHIAVAFGYVFHLARPRCGDAGQFLRRLCPDSKIYQPGQCQQTVRMVCRQSGDSGHLIIEWLKPQPGEADNQILFWFLYSEIIWDYPYCRAVQYEICRRFAECGRWDVRSDDFCEFQRVGLQDSTVENREIEVRVMPLLFLAWTL